MIVSALLKPFYELLKSSPSRALTCEGEGQVTLINVDIKFRNQSQLLFELVQLLVKPLVNALMQDQRKDVTEALVQFFVEYDFSALALGVFADDTNDILTRMMGIKCFKSLFVLTNQSKLATKQIVSA